MYKPIERVHRNSSECHTPSVRGVLVALFTASTRGIRSRYDRNPEVLSISGIQFPEYCESVSIRGIGPQNESSAGSIHISEPRPTGNKDSAENGVSLSYHQHSQYLPLFPLKVLNSTATAKSMSPFYMVHCP